MTEKEKLAMIEETLEMEEGSLAPEMELENIDEYNSMAKLSYLFIGHSESLFGMNTKFEFLKTDWACLYQKNI